MFPQLEIEDFLNTIRSIEGLKHKKILVTASDGLQAFDTFRGYDRAAVEIENLASIRMQLSMPELSAAAIMGQTILVDKFQIDGIDTLRKNVAKEFGQGFWPAEEPLTTPILLQILEACEEALESKKKIVTAGPRSLRWEFEESTAAANIAAINECDIIAPYDRLKATLIQLANDGDIDQALVEFKTVESFEEFRSADEEISEQGITPFDKEVKFEFPMP